ncbi:MAG: cytochrome c biogenesis protein CcdA [Candidatus Magasanikbacteria bacterium]|uniref:Cytochrome C biogenesis protein n=1 Tax=Candidatus Magasanikbacteria bacterium CG10_big_fil_rev_8_21_14_0_10_38_6 TaxID=1974647 RepID=A0A2M6P1V6_9BACT|nr:cytochrome c biogenesis protein CcdA [Candidatus Magasanikbacteria bacterium]NCS71938.1 cytochrome c biogenesis protein CcdA [Candidatus Magasanikbacteria bacterium]PIR77410.1 MAG: cytochrome C biogenesis protein [Candidatus Magasanikbacteria bacterium CG10_big_fil_rev_8_21_14_0_10_38_6]
MDISLIIPAFVAGLITFLAPCTLPLVPGFLGFISGISVSELNGPKQTAQIKKRIIINGILYVIGFTTIFMIMGTFFGVFGVFLSTYRIWLSRIGGSFVIFFGLYLMHVFKGSYFSFLHTEHRFNLVGKLTPGKPASSFLFGATFAFGWTPCVGPILGAILLLASTTGTLAQGALLLFVFSLGLAIPFLLIAIGFGHASIYIKKLNKYLNAISIVGGAFLVIIGVLLLTNKLGIWVSIFYNLFEFLNYQERLLNFL